MCGSMADIESATAEIRRGKNRKIYGQIAEISVPYRKSSWEMW